MKILTTNKINNICTQIIQQSEKYDFYAYLIFDTLYKTGLRINEVIEFERITLLSEEKILIDTEKKSSNRIFNKSELNEIYFDLITNDLTSLINFNYRKLTRTFNKLCQYSEIYTQQKQLTTHLFRHNKAKQLKQSGLTDYEIQNYLGEKDLKNAQNYINSIIYIN